MDLMTGSRLRSQVCTTEVIVIRGGSLDDDLTCGGRPMTSAAQSGDPTGAPSAGLDTGTQLGKRYSNGVIEVLVTRAGQGTIAVGEDPLLVQGARQLPSSD